MAGEITGFLHIVRIDAPIDPINAEYRNPSTFTERSAITPHGSPE